MRNAERTKSHLGKEASLTLPMPYATEGIIGTNRLWFAFSADKALETEFIFCGNKTGAAFSNLQFVGKLRTVLSTFLAD